MNNAALLGDRYSSLLKGGEPVHYPRFCRAAEWIAPLMQPDASVLDCGAGDNPFRGLIEREWPHVAFSDTGESDLRYPLPFDSNQFDLVLCMEVIEHLKDRVEDDRALATGSGVRNLVSEIARILKPGGRVFLSTPNLACWQSIHLLLTGRHPYFFQGHHRELTWNEVSAYLCEAGLEVERCETLDVWNHHGLPGRTIESLRSAFAQFTNSHSSHGDCIFAIAGKHGKKCQ
jgi:SAM-dependent methyltransferase